MDDVLDTSTSVVIAGFVLLLGVAVLASFAYLGRGEVGDDGQPDLFGSRVAVPVSYTHLTLPTKA